MGSVEKGATVVQTLADQPDERDGDVWVGVRDEDEAA